MYVVRPQNKSYSLASKSCSLAVALMIVTACTKTYAQWPCTAANFTTDQIRSIVKQARDRFSNLPREPSKYTWSILKIGCHYLYIEDAREGSNRSSVIFTLNASGTLVDFEYLPVH